ncbi:unnamed protein product [Litomosoides sigmodontis]|uniref:Uncharacterized protein n=1 Tax=Litomosoides sigmodontis TaxID=42156 RepID=A0A3P6TCF4_LITSI|nr:unnamed protein product [Litomosoides sigmodontis]
MESLKKLLQQYKTEILDDYTLLCIQARLIRIEIDNQIKHYHQRLKKLQPQMHGKKSQLLSVITNVTPVRYDAEKIMHTYMWTALLLLIHAIFSTLSAYLFSVLIRQIISGFIAAISAYVILPLITYHYINKLSMSKYAWNDMILRHGLLAFAIIEGLLTGYILSNRTLQSLPPLAALTPCFIGIIAPVLQSTATNERSSLLLVAVAGSFSSHLLIGMFAGLVFPYLLLVIFYTTIAFVTLQLLIANIDENVTFTHIYQFAIFYFSLLVESIVYKLFGTKL